MDAIVFRAVEDSDIGLIEKWLYKERIISWFTEPQDWLLEIRQRRSAFLWLNHFMVIVGDVPIGFCQYYDCFDAKEEWYAVERRGEMYSIDYLIGEDAYLGKGIGKTIIKKLVDIIFTEKGGKTIVVQPDSDNERSNGALEANGFIFDDKTKYYLKRRETHCIAKIDGNSEKLDEALALVWQVFSAFEAPEYPSEGIKEFKDYIGKGSIARKLETGELLMWCAFEGERIVGVIASRRPCHISLLFVAKDRHRRGIAKQLLMNILNYYKQNTCFSEVTVNSSPYAKEIYHKLGFTDTDEERTVNGIRFTPMKRTI